MALTFRSPEDVAEEYLLHLESLKGDKVDISRTDSDWWIRAQVVGGAISGCYADLLLVSGDAFPQKARHDALGDHLVTYFGSGFNPATNAIGSIRVNGTVGKTLPALTQFVYPQSGNVYQTTEDVLFTAATGAVPAQSVATGQAQNLLAGAPLVMSSPPVGFQTAASALTDFSDARNGETDPEAAARILARIRTPLAGGKVSDYQQFATDADPSVVSASILRFPFGLGSVGIIISAGTTDIDAAIDNGDPVVLIPSDALVAEVQAYIETQKPVTDCPVVLKPVPLPVDVTVKVAYVTGNGSTLLESGITQEQAVIREVWRAIYKTPGGGRVIGASGYVVASDIEQTIDTHLSGEPFETGTLNIIEDREVLDLAATGRNLAILGTHRPIPGIITVESF